ncbi:MAG: lipid-A-disaccharide synthase N-terminal domain-containing protein [bacterium]
MLQNFITWYQTMPTVELIWICIGFFGQAMFGSRFLVQWIASEKKGESTIPTVFWYLSLGGSLIVLSYAIYRIDPVFIVSQAGGSFIYLRNLMLIHQNPEDSIKPSMS